MIGETAAALMETLPDETDGEVQAVGIVVVVDAGDCTYRRIKCSDDRLFAQLGIFHAAILVATDGTDPDEDDDD